MMRVKGSESRAYGYTCTLCRMIIGDYEDVVVIEGHPFHASCFDRLLKYPEERFSEVLSFLPGRVREELRRMRGGEQQPTQPTAAPRGEEGGEELILGREARKLLWVRSKEIVSAALKSAGLRYVGEMRIDGLSPEHYSRFLITIREEIAKMIKEPRRVEFRIYTYVKGFADTDIFIDGEYFGTWKPIDPYVGAFWSWVRRIYNLLKHLAERGLLREEVYGGAQPAHADVSGAEGVDEEFVKALRESWGKWDIRMLK